MLIIQWNAKSLVAHGSEFKKYVSELLTKPDIICFQETWLKEHNRFHMPGYSLIRRDRARGKGGGCGIMVKFGVPFTETEDITELECILIKVHGSRGRVTIINFYNPCQPLMHKSLQEVFRRCEGVVLVCGDFNSHNILWGSKDTDRNGNIIEDLIDEFDMVILNDGQGTCINPSTGKMSPLDLTLISSIEAARCDWEVHDDNLGSDHFPVITNLQCERGSVDSLGPASWNFSKANWGQFSDRCVREVKEEIGVHNIDSINKNIVQIMYNIA